MGDIGAFPTIRNVLWSGNNIVKLTATTAVKAGQVVGINATGVSGAVDKCVAASGEMPIGVAIYDAAAGADVAVATVGCIVYVANALDDTDIDAGSWLETNDNTVGGTVNAVAVAAIAGAVGTGHFGVIGVAIDDIAKSTTGRMLILGPQNVTQLNNA